MTDIKLYTKILSLPDSLKIEVSQFIDALKSKSDKNKKKPKKRIFGYAKGTITIKSDFDEPLADFKDYM